MGSRDETYAAIRSLLASLGDPFTRFLSPEQYAALRWEGSCSDGSCAVAFHAAAT